MNCGAAFYGDLSQLRTKLEDQRGDPGQAEALRRDARTSVEYIADRAGTAELRASFLAREDVQAVQRGV